MIENVVLVEDVVKDTIGEKVPSLIHYLPVRISDSSPQHALRALWMRMQSRNILLLSINI